VTDNYDPSFLVQNPANAGLNFAHVAQWIKRLDAGDAPQAALLNLVTPVTTRGKPREFGDGAVRGWKLRDLVVLESDLDDQDDAGRTMLVLTFVRRPRRADFDWIEELLLAADRFLAGHQLRLGVATRDATRLALARLAGVHSGMSRADDRST